MAVFLLAALVPISGTTRLVSATPSTAPCGEGSALDSARVVWSRLSYRAAKLLISARAEVAMEIVPPGRTETVVAVEESGKIRARATEEETLHLVLTSKLLGQVSGLEVWADPRSGRALQRIQLEERKGRHKIYRFFSDGVSYWRKSPANHLESRSGPESWTLVEEAHFPYPSPGCDPIVTEPSALFYLLSAGGPLKIGQSRQIWIFSKKRFTPVELKVVGQSEIRVDYVQESSSGEEHHRERKTALRVSIRPQAAGLGGEATDFKFLGLEGAVDLDLDEATGIPLQVTGRVPIAGRIKVKLKRVVLRPDRDSLGRT